MVWRNVPSAPSRGMREKQERAENAYEMQRWKKGPTFRLVARDLRCRSTLFRFAKGYKSVKKNEL